MRPVQPVDPQTDQRCTDNGQKDEEGRRAGSQGVGHVFEELMAGNHAGFKNSCNVPAMSFGIRSVRANPVTAKKRRRLIRTLPRGTGAPIAAARPRPSAIPEAVTRGRVPGVPARASKDEDHNFGPFSKDHQEHQSERCQCRLPVHLRLGLGKNCIEPVLDRRPDAPAGLPHPNQQRRDQTGGPRHQCPLAQWMIRIHPRHPQPNTNAQSRQYRCA